MRKISVYETLVLAALLFFSLYSLCWGPPGPPDPPSVPVGNIGMSALTVLGMAGYGFWKMRK